MTTTTPQLDEFTNAYLECALWSTNDESTPSGGCPLDDNYSIEDIDPEMIATAVADCERFQRDHAALLEGQDLSRAGHDFWLTRNGHGAGFWDGDWGDLGDALDEACEPYKEINLCVENGTVYQL